MCLSALHREGVCVYICYSLKLPGQSAFVLRARPRARLRPDKRGNACTRRLLATEARQHILFYGSMVEGGANAEVQVGPESRKSCPWDM